MKFCRLMKTIQIFLGINAPLHINYLLDGFSPYKKVSKKQYKLRPKLWINCEILSKMKEGDKLLFRYCKIVDNILYYIILYYIILYYIILNILLIFVVVVHLCKSVAHFSFTSHSPTLC